MRATLAHPLQTSPNMLVQVISLPHLRQLHLKDILFMTPTTTTAYWDSLLSFYLSTTNAKMFLSANTSVSNVIVLTKETASTNRSKPEEESANAFQHLVQILNAVAPLRKTTKKLPTSAKS